MGDRGRSMRAPRRAIFVLVALVAAWHLGASLPLNGVEDGHIALLEKEAKPLPADAAVAKTKQKVANALAKVHKKGIKASVDGVDTAAPTATTPITTSAGPGPKVASNIVAPKATQGSAPSNPSDDTKVAVPGLPATSSITKRTQPLAVPGGKKYLNRDIPVGKSGRTKQQAEAAILSGDHAMHKIETKLVKDRAARYSEARGAVELKQATEAAADAAANLATAIRKSAARKAAEADARVTMLKAKIEKAKGKRRASLQIKLAKATEKSAGLMKKAAIAGKAVNQAIAKAASVQGIATAQAVADQDETTRYEHAIVAAAQAKMNLAAFDKTTAVKNRQEEADKKQKEFWKKQQVRLHKGIKVAKQKFDAASRKAEETEHKAATAAALAFAKKSTFSRDCGGYLNFNQSCEHCGTGS